MDINSISPNFRDFLLNKNLISKLSNYYPNNNSNDLLYKTQHLQPNGEFQGGDIRKFNTVKNLYLDVEQQEIINLNTNLVASQQFGSYIDENNNLGIGGASTQPLDIIGTILNGQSLGVSSKGIVDSFDIRTSLAGRVLGASGIIKDTKLGLIGAQQLALALANNAAFGLQQETIGHINTNPLSLIKGNSIIIPNYTITVPKGKLGKAADFLGRVLGFEVPVSILATSSSIFTKENPVSNITRANEMIHNTGKGQILALFANINQNKYKPAFSDERTKKGVNKAAEGTNPELYAFDDGTGGVIDFINDTVGVDGTKINSPISQSNYNLDGLMDASGFKGLSNIEAITNDGSTTKFTWSDKDGINGRTKTVITDYDTLFTNKKTLLGKTKELFNTNKMKTLTSGHGVFVGSNDEISTTVRGFISKGSGVLSEKALKESSPDPKVMFCRTWTTLDKYNKVQNLQKHKGLYGTEFSYRNGSENSVLDDNGFVRITPYKTDGKDMRNYMFSLENLAWNDNLINLLDSEIGLGDGKVRGRIMWFPPYDLNVSENNSSNWDSTNFIGRGEPLYNYNNSERSGTLSFKVIVDHPSYLNALTEQEDEYITSFFAGCTEMDSLISSRLTTTEIQDVKQNNVTKLQTKDIEPQTPPPSFTIYFPNDSYSIPSSYEDGLNTTGMGETTGNGVTNPPNTSFPDHTNFGLNGKDQPLVMDGVSFSGWVNGSFVGELKVYLKEKCPQCRIDVSGYASQQGLSNANQELSNKRATSVETWIKSQLLYPDDPLFNNRVKPPKGKGEANDMSDKPCRKGVTEDIDKIGCKINRKVKISFEFDPSLHPDSKPDETVKTEENPNIKVNKKIINRFYDESKYFEKLKQEDSFVFDKIRDKIKYFHPAFHSSTPEGLNSRLNFLLQCTRQGPTINGENATNLAFGRPPVCILRLGDFYHSKIIIDNVSINYDTGNGIQWDLNPEGIGVQPMIANVDLSFKFIGGQSLYGPINKLQNAVSFNFFANTHVYDERSDKLMKNDKPDNNPKLILKEGGQVAPPIVEVVNEGDISGIGSRNTTVPTDQQSVANKQTNQETNTNSDPKINGFTIGGVYSALTDWYIIISLNTENIITDVQKTTFVNKGIKIKITRDNSFYETTITSNVYFDTKNSTITIPISNIPASTKACNITLTVGGERKQSQNIILN